MPANWRDDCPHEREGAESQSACQCSGGIAHNATLSDLNSAPKGPAGGEMSARKELRWEERPNGQCVLCAVPEALLHANAAAKQSTNSPGRVPGFVAPARSQFSDSTTAERRAWSATRWQHGRARQTCPQPAAVVSDQFGFSSGVGQFCKRSLRSAAKAGSSPRLFLLSGPDEVARAIAAVLGDRRSLAP